MEPTQLYKSVALKYKDVLTFGLYANPSAQAMQQLQVKKLPQLMVFFSQNGTAESLQVHTKQSPRPPPPHSPFRSWSSPPVPSPSWLLWSRMKVGAGPQSVDPGASGYLQRAPGCSKAAPACACVCLRVKKSLRPEAGRPGCKPEEFAPWTRATRAQALSHAVWLGEDEEGVSCKAQLRCVGWVARRQ